MRRFSIIAASLLVFSPALPAQTVIGDLYASDASVRGSVTLAAGGTQVMAGSSVTAGERTATLRLARGGELRVCPTTSISVSAAPQGKELMIGLGTGAMEAHYRLGANADSVMTPDFRILLAGPGEFHFAFGADVRGNTCVRSLPSNNASVLVMELMGDGSYQVRPGDQVLFREGKLAQVTAEVESCGCPPPPEPVHRAEIAPRAPEPAAEPEKLPAGLAIPKTDAAEMTALTAPPPPLAPTEVHIAVDAPFVFNAREAAPPPPLMTRLEVSSIPKFPMLRAEPLPPPAPPSVVAPQVAEQKKPRKKGLFGRLGAFFASIFGG